MILAEEGADARRTDRAGGVVVGRARGRVGLVQSNQAPWLRQRDHSPGRGIDVLTLAGRLGFEVSVSVGGQPSLSLRVDDNLQRHVEAEVSGDTLRIGLERGTSVSDATLQAEITAPSLTQVQASGASRISLDDRLEGNDLRLERDRTRPE